MIKRRNMPTKGMVTPRPNANLSFSLKLLSDGGGCGARVCAEQLAVTVSPSKPDVTVTEAVGKVPVPEMVTFDVTSG
jgi:hypothetical protein